MFVHNAWYVAGWDHEVGREPLARTILDQPVVLYRKENDGIVALEDRCCHRHYPLSRGEPKGDGIQCGCHGMVFDGSGASCEIPWQAEIPSLARVRSYPVVERFHWIWIWMGDAADADPDEITDFHWLDDPAAPMVDLSQDAGGLAARKLIDRLARSEMTALQAAG